MSATTERLQAFRYALRPTQGQDRLLRRFAGAARFVFNEALRLQQCRFEQQEKRLSRSALSALLTGWRNDVPTPGGRCVAWLSDAPSQCLQQKLIDLENAYHRAFNGLSQFPRLK